MMSKWSRWLEITTNFAVLGLCCLVAIFLIRNNIKIKAPSPPQAASAVGTHLDVPGLNWNAPNKTLVLALSTQCHFCNESSPFYERLISSAADKHTRIVAVFPQRIEESTQYAANKHLRFDVVLNAPLNELHVNGTPTVFLTDDKGTVKSAWVGRLDPNKEKEVMSQL